jgi:hypothetical protein
MESITNTDENKNSNNDNVVKPVRVKRKYDNSKSKKKQQKTIIEPHIVIQLHITEEDIQNYMSQRIKMTNDVEPELSHKLPIPYENYETSDCSIVGGNEKMNVGVNLEITNVEITDKLNVEWNEDNKSSDILIK